MIIVAWTKNKMTIKRVCKGLFARREKPLQSITTITIKIGLQSVENRYAQKRTF